MRYDLKPIIQTYYPSLFELLGNNEISWRDINNAFAKNMQNVKEEYNKKKAPIIKEVSFHSIIKHKLQGSGYGDAQFEFYNYLFIQLKEVLSINERNLIHGILKNILVHINKDYLNFIGELCVLLFYKTNTAVTLINVEEKLSSESNQSADFLFKDSNNEHLLIEVVNIHLEARNNLNMNNIGLVINSKLEQKKKAKLIDQTRPIKIQPFIWMKDYQQNQIVSEYFSQENVIMEDTIHPLCYISLTHEKYRFEHRISLVNQSLRKQKS